MAEEKKVRTELYPCQVIAAYRALQSNEVVEGHDYKDVSVSNEQKVIQALGFEPESMPCSVNTPRAFWKWMHALRNEYLALQRNTGVVNVLNIAGLTCYASEVSLKGRHMGEDFLPFVVGEGDWAMLYEPLYVLTENTSKYGLTFHTTDEGSVLDLALEIKNISCCHTEIKRGSRVIAMVDQGEVIHLD